MSNILSASSNTCAQHIRTCINTCVQYDQNTTSEHNHNVSVLRGSCLIHVPLLELREMTDKRNKITYPQVDITFMKSQVDLNLC